MCNPAIIMAVVAAGTELMEGYSEKQQADYRYKVERYNSRLSENEAIRTRNKGVEEENKLRRAVAEQTSRQRTQIAANNLDLNVGSSLQIQQDTELLGEVDALRIRENYEQQASALDSESELALSRGKAIKKAGKRAWLQTVFIDAPSAGFQAYSGGGMGGSGSSGGSVNSSWYGSDSSAMSGNGQQFGNFA